MERRKADSKLARAVVGLHVKVKRLEQRQKELEEELRKAKEALELRLKLLEQEVRKW